MGPNELMFAVLRYHVQPGPGVFFDGGRPSEDNEFFQSLLIERWRVNASLDVILEAVLPPLTFHHVGSEAVCS